MSRTHKCPHCGIKETVSDEMDKYTWLSIHINQCNSRLAKNYRKARDEDGDQLYTE